MNATWKKIKRSCPKCRHTLVMRDEKDSQPCKCENCGYYESNKRKG